MSTWYESWFESPWYMKLYRHRTEEEAREAIDLVRTIANVPVGARVLDLCCGYGRHALALAEAGYRVTGIDSSHFLIERASEIYPHPNVHYAVGDMRGPYPDAPFDAVVNFFTSFGYFDTTDEDQRVLDTIYASLSGGGQFVMDFFNAHYVRTHLEAETMSLVESATIIQERSITDGFVHKRITINVPCSYERDYAERVRLYTRADLESMFTSAGFIIDHVLGNYNGSSFEEAASPRCIIIAHKP